MTYNFTATLNRPCGARIFKGTMDGCHDLSMALFATRELLSQYSAFQDNVTDLKITISPSRKKSKSPLKS